MRTTVTIDDELAQLLKEAMHRQSTKFDDALNTALRRGLAGTTPTVAGSDEPFEVQDPFIGELQPSIDPVNLKKLAADLEDEEFLRRTRAGR